MNDDETTRIRRRRWIATLLLATSLVIAAAGLRSVELDHALGVMLPDNSESLALLNLLQHEQFARHVVLSFGLADEQASLEDAMAEVDRILERLDPGLLRRAPSLDPNQLTRDAALLFDQAPALLDEQDMQALTRRLQPDQVDELLREKRRELMKPQGAFMGALIRHDPLDLTGRVADKLQGVLMSFGYDVQTRGDHLVSRDERHLLVALETSVSIADTRGARQLIEHLDTLRASLPAWLHLNVVCAHRHTVGNEDVIRRDIRVTITVASLVFIGLFIWVFRDISALAIFCVPLVSILYTVHVERWFLGALSPMTLGLGSVVAGISVDYGIHVYMALRARGGQAGAVAAIGRPLLLGGATTAGMFLAFTFSAIPGYRQLGLFALLCVVFSLALAYCVLPLYIRRSSLPPADAPGQRWPIIALPPRMILVVYGLLMLAALPFASRVELAGDMTTLDGAPAEVWADEARFQEIWGTGKDGQAMLIISGPDLEEALRRHEAAVVEAERLIGAGQLGHISSIWPSGQRRQANQARWRAFWSEEKIAETQALFRERGERIGFQPDAFDPFFTGLRDQDLPEWPEDNAILAQLQRRFIQVHPDDVRVLAYFADTEANSRAMKSLAHPEAGRRLVSRRIIADTLTHDYTTEVMRVAGLALILAVGCCAVLWRDLRMTAIALLPPATAVMAILAAAGGRGVPVNIMSLVAGIVVIGLCIDYGIFMAFKSATGLRAGTGKAVALSAGTTLIGSGALLFAHHPALFSIGNSLFIGVAAGYLAAITVVPALCSLRRSTP